MSFHSQAPPEPSHKQHKPNMYAIIYFPFNHISRFRLKSIWQRFRSAPTSRLCVKNIPKHMKEERLRQHFGQRGEVTDVKIMKTAYISKTKICFCDFSAIIYLLFQIAQRWEIAIVRLHRLPHGEGGQGRHELLQQHLHRHIQDQRRDGSPGTPLHCFFFVCFFCPFFSAHAVHPRVWAPARWATMRCRVRGVSTPRAALSTSRKVGLRLSPSATRAMTTS